MSITTATPTPTASSFSTKQVASAAAITTVAVAGTALNIAGQAGLALARAANFFVREVVQCHAPQAAATAVSNYSIVKAACTAAAAGESALNAASAQAIENVSALSEADVTNIVRSIDFSW